VRRYSEVCYKLAAFVKSYSINTDMEGKNYRFTFARIETINLEFFYFHVHSRAPYIYIYIPHKSTVRWNKSN